MKLGGAKMFVVTKTEKILKGLLTGGILYVASYVLIFIASNSNASSEIGHNMALGVLLVGTFCKPIGIFIIFKFLYDALSKILKNIDKCND